MKLNYKKFGEGVPVVIIHGLYGSSDNWVTVGRKLAENFEVYLIDQRNHGRSPHSEEHNYELMRDDLLEFMNDHQLERAHLIGHSMGGKTAMFFAAAYPERVQSLVVVDIAPKSYLSLGSFSQQTIDHERIISSMRTVDFSKVKRRYDVEAHLAKWVANEPTRMFLLKNLKRDGDNFRWRINIDALHENIHEILEGLNPDDFKQGKGITGFPVLFIRGEKSEYVLPEDIDLIETIFPFAELVTIPNAGHWVHAQQPHLLIKNIEYFILN